jgi:hypothetical protein
MFEVARGNTGIDTHPAYETTIEFLVKGFI